MRRRQKMMCITFLCAVESDSPTNVLSPVVSPRTHTTPAHVYENPVPFADEPDSKQSGSHNVWLG
jgi:hypothetical protein